jgi:hypothetical protein
MLCSVARPENAAQSERDGFDLRLVHSIVDRFITRKDYLHPERFDYDSLADLLASDSQYGNTLPGRAPRQPDRESQERERRERRERDRDQEQHRERIEKRSRVNTLKALLENCDLPTDSHDAADLDAYANTLEVRLEQHLAAARDQQHQQQPLLAPGYGASNKQYKALSSLSLIVKEGRVWAKHSDPPVDYGQSVRDRCSLQCPGHLNMATPPTVEGKWAEWNKTPEGKRNEPPPQRMVMPHFPETCRICIADVERHCEQNPADKARYLVFYESSDWEKRLPPARSFAPGSRRQ